MDCDRYPQRGFFEGKWKSLCDHSTCEKVQDTRCYCIYCHLGRDADHNTVLSQNGVNYDCFHRALLQADLTIEGNGDQKVCRGLSLCPVQLEFFLLQRILRETGRPPTVDRRDDPRCPAGNEITIVYLAELQESQAPFFEGKSLILVLFIARLLSSFLLSSLSSLLSTSLTSSSSLSFSSSKKK